MVMPVLRVEFLQLHPYAKIPEYATPGSSGMDVFAIDKGILYPGEIALIPFGFALALPDRFEIQVRPRSGLAMRHGISLVNSPGTIDSDYRGEIKGIFINHGKKPWTWKVHDKIAQLVIQKLYYQKLGFGVVKSFTNETERGDGGFGSTGQ